MDKGNTGGTMKRIPYANGEFKLDEFKGIKYQPITIEWLRDFFKSEGLPIKLRPYQERIVTKTVNHFLVDKLHCILLESATGSGKTVMGLSICLVLQKLTGSKTSWTTLRRELLKQAEKSNEELMKNKVMLNTISMMMKEPEKDDILVVDEAHKDATSSMANIHAKVNARFILLLSATPIRADKATIFYDKIIKDSGIRSLIRDGWLSSFNLWNIEEWTPKIVAETYLQDREKWGKSAVFFHKQEQCDEFKALMEEAGVPCEVVTGKSDRDTQLARFENGEVPILVNMMVLTEGFDCPSLETVFVRDSYKGTTVQMAGRVLRLWENDKGEHIVKNIVQSKCTDYPFSREATPEKKYVWDNDDWVELGKNNRVETMAKAMMQRVVNKAQLEAVKEPSINDINQRIMKKSRKTRR